MKDPRRLWPSRAVNLNGLMELLGYARSGQFYRDKSKTATDVSPDDAEAGYLHCTTCNQESVTVTRRRTGPVSAWFVCWKCRQKLDPISYAARVWTTDVGDVITRINTAGLFTSKRAVTKDQTVPFRRFVRARAAYDRFDVAMRSRTMRSVTDSDIHAALRITDQPHVRGHWWTSTLKEIEVYIGDHSEPRGRLSAEFGVPDSTVALVIPAYGVDRRLVGVIIGSAVRSNGAIMWLTRCATGDSGGLTNLDNAPQRTSSVSMNFGLLVDRFNKIRNGQAVPTEFVVGPIDGELVAMIRDELTANVTVTVPAIDALGDRALYLARRLDARIHVLTGADEDLTWQRALYVTTERDLQVLRLRKMSPTDSADVQWGPAEADQAVATGRLTKREADTITLRIGHALKVGHGGNTLVPLRRGLTVEIDGTGWSHQETGMLLTRAVPYVTRIYRDEARKIRYVGFIKYGAAMYHFDSSQFRKNPAAVIEATMLRHGVDPPAIHPIVVPYIATLALFLRKPCQ